MVQIRPGFLDRLSTIVLTLVALLVGGLALKRELSPAPSDPRSQTAVTRIKDWDKISEGVSVPVDPEQRLQMLSGVRIKGRDGVWRKLPPLTITVFTDFQCPACRDSDSLLSRLSEKYPTLQRRLVHFPLKEQHGQALLAAQAFECADQVGQGHEMHGVLFKNQSLLGVKPWADLALEAQVEDTASFRRCLVAGSGERISAGISLAEKLKVNITPTAVIDGWLIQPAVPARVEAVLDSIVRHTKSK